MATRNPFAFLDDESPQRRVLLLLLALIRKSGGSVSLTVGDLTSVEDGSSFSKEPDDKGTSLVLRFARRGAEAYFLTATEDAPSTPVKSRSTVRVVTPPLQPEEDPSLSSPVPRHAIHDDVDLAMREEEMATRAQKVQRARTRQAQAEAGLYPWTTRQPQ